MLVLDASLAVDSSMAGSDLSERLGDGLVAPALMWSEARTTLHLMMFHGALSQADARAAHVWLESAPIERIGHEDLGSEAWRVADELGWGRTYDAEYIALARLLGCRLVTVDGRLRRGADRLGFVIVPTEL